MKEHENKVGARVSRMRDFLGSGRVLLTAVAFILAVSVVVYGVFQSYSASLRDEFYEMTSEGMNDFTTAQKVEVEAFLREVQSTLSTMRALAESSDVDPKGATFVSFLESWNSQGSYQVTYVSMADLEAEMGNAAFSESDRKNVERLKAGESVVSDVRKSKRLGGYYFSIGEPVKENGVVIGVLRSAIEAEKLLATSQVSSQVVLISSVLIREDGAIVADSESTEPYDGKSLYELLSDEGFSSDVVSAAKANVENEKDVATTTLGSRNSKMLFLTSIRLGANDWTIVNITQENTMAEHSQVILHDTVIAGALLIGTSMVVSVLVAIVLVGYRRRATREAQRYTVLAEFSDTILFEYTYRDGKLELTPNAQALFDLETLSRERYLERQMPLMRVHEDDYQHFRDLLENPAAKGEVRKIVLRIQSPSGEYRWYSCACRYLYDGASLYAAVGKLVDITQQHAKEERLKRQSQLDGLTKILNKVTVESRISTLLETSGPGLLFVIDVDQFKLINDENGHIVGDRVLACIARALLDAFRKNDPVGRVGGDEFVAYAVEAEDDKMVEKKRESIRELIDAVSEEMGLPVDLSIGVARFPEDGTTYQELFEAADRAMYKEKKQRSSNQ